MKNTSNVAGWRETTWTTQNCGPSNKRLQGTLVLPKGKKNGKYGNSLTHKVNDVLSLTDLNLHIWTARALSFSCI